MAENNVCLYRVDCDGAKKAWGVCLQLHERPSGAHEANRQEQFCSMITLLLPSVRGLPKRIIYSSWKVCRKGSESN